LLGWSLDDRTESFTREEMIESFSLERVNRAPASFDPAKLFAFQERAMRALPVDARVERCLPFLARAGWVGTPPSTEEAHLVRRIVEAAEDRIRVAGDVLEFGEFFVADDRLQYEEGAFEKRLVRDAEAAARLERLSRKLAASRAFAAPDLEQLVRDFVEEEGVRIGDVIHALRVAVTGKSVGFGMFETLEVLGRERSLARIGRALERARNVLRGSP
jgi:glutamyl-tRNA synthetase